MDRSYPCGTLVNSQFGLKGIEDVFMIGWKFQYFMPLWSDICNFLGFGLCIVKNTVIIHTKVSFVITFCLL